MNHLGCAARIKVRMHFTNSLWRRILWQVSAAVLLGAGTVAGVSAQALQGQALVQELQRGGYVIVFRHSLTDATKPDRDRIDLNDCQTQRDLTQEGRILARQIGTVFDRLQIPVDKVYASPLCRTLWTADLAFGHATVVPGLREPQPKNEANSVKAAAVLRPLIAAVPAPGTDTVIVTHGFNIKSITDYIPDEGEATIFKPSGNGSFTLIARVKATDWEGFGK